MKLGFVTIFCKWLWVWFSHYTHVWEGESLTSCDLFKLFFIKEETIYVFHILVRYVRQMENFDLHAVPGIWGNPKKSE
jgi:hypothetical protein